MERTAVNYLRRALVIVACLVVLGAGAAEAGYPGPHATRPVYHGPGPLVKKRAYLGVRKPYQTARPRHGGHHGQYQGYCAEDYLTGNWVARPMQ